MGVSQRHPYPLNSGRKAPQEHHGLRVSIRREEETPEGTRSTEVQALRGAPTPRDLDGYAFWWLDRWAESEPGTLFYARLAETEQVARVRLPKDFPAIPLPETSAEYDARVRDEYIRREQEHEAQSSKLARVVLAESERVLERLRRVRDGNATVNGVTP